MTYKAVITREAQREYESIVSYLASTLLSPATASDFMNEFDHQIALVCEMPLMHPLSHLPELAALGYRPIHIKRYVALYKVTNDKIVIAHIFHQTQDYARLV